MIIPVVATIPHSGMWIPKSIAKTFTQHHLNTLRNTDWHLDKLYDFLPTLGVHVLVANFSRYVADPNRSAEKPLFGSYKSSIVYDKNTWGEEIYETIPEQKERMKRFTNYYLPYHEALRDLLNDLSRYFERLYLLDLHSFMGPIENDVCLGDGYGSTCRENLLGLFENGFVEAGYDTVINKPFSGGHIVKICSELPFVEALQIELRYTTYLENKDLDSGVIPRADCQKLESARSRLKALFSNLLPQIATLS